MLTSAPSGRWTSAAIRRRAASCSITSGIALSARPSIEQPSAIAQAGQHISRIRQRCRCGIRKTLIELPDLHRPAMLAQPFRHAPVVQVTASWSIEPSRDDENN